MGKSILCFDGEFAAVAVGDVIKIVYIVSRSTYQFTSDIPRERVLYMSEVYRQGDTISLSLFT